MLSFRVRSTHEKYTETYQHWSPQSENYAGGDHLISALRVGWVLDERIVYAEQTWKSGTRPVTLYHFSLTRDGEIMIMPVLSNPYVERYLVENFITIVYNDTHREKDTVRVY